MRIKWIVQYSLVGWNSHSSHSRIGLWSGFGFPWRSLHNSRGTASGGDCAGVGVGMWVVSTGVWVCLKKCGCVCACRCWCVCAGRCIGVCAGMWVWACLCKCGCVNVVCAGVRVCGCVCRWVGGCVSVQVWLSAQVYACVCRCSVCGVIQII